MKIVWLKEAIENLSEDGKVEILTVIEGHRFLQSDGLDL